MFLYFPGYHNFKSEKVSHKKYIFFKHCVQNMITVTSCQWGSNLLSPLCLSHTNISTPHCISHLHFPPSLSFSKTCPCLRAETSTFKRLLGPKNPEQTNDTLPPPYLASIECILVLLEAAQTLSTLPSSQAGPRLAFNSPSVTTQT